MASTLIVIGLIVLYLSIGAFAAGFFEVEEVTLLVVVFWLPVALIALIVLPFAVLHIVGGKFSKRLNNRPVWNKRPFFEDENGKHNGGGEIHS